MKSKLKCVLVDDELDIHKAIHECLSDSLIAELTETYLCPKAFLKAEPALDFDICLLDICMPDMGGFEVADILKKKKRKVIFISGQSDMVIDALKRLDPIDVVPKPTDKQRLNFALEKAEALIKYNVKEAGSPDVSKTAQSVLFNVAEASEKIRLQVSDIYFVEKDSDYSKNKHIILKDGRQYTLMRYTFEELLTLSPALVQVNRSKLVSTEAVQKVKHDLITLKFHDPREVIVKQITLNRTFRKNFMSRMES